MSNVIDAHMHIGKEELLSADIVDFMKSKGSWKNIENKISVEGILAALDKADIDKGVIFPLTFMPPDGQWQKMNDLTASYVEAHPDRFIGYGIINPLEIDASVKELERCFDTLEFYGIKLHPSMQEFYPHEENLYPIYELCQEKGKVVLFHTGASVASHSDKYSHPILLDEIAVRFPALKMIIAHAGRPYYQDAALLVRKHKNVYIDICANLGRTGGTYLLEQVLTWMKVYADGIKRALFATDYPVFDPRSALQDLQHIRESHKLPNTDEPLISDEEWELMTHLNAERVILHQENH